MMMWKWSKLGCVEDGWYNFTSYERWYGEWNLYHVVVVNVICTMHKGGGESKLDHIYCLQSMNNLIIVTI